MVVVGGGAVLAAPKETIPLKFIAAGWTRLLVYFTGESKRERTFRIHGKTIRDKWSKRTIVPTGITYFQFVAFIVRSTSILRELLIGEINRTAN